MIYADHPDREIAILSAHRRANRTGRDVGVKVGNWGSWPHMAAGWYCETTDILGSEYVAIADEVTDAAIAEEWAAYLARVEVK